MPTVRRVNRDELLEAALALLDESGMGGLSMRLLADRVGVRAPSLYEHIASRRDLLTAIADRVAISVFEGLSSPSAGSFLEAVAYRLRDRLRKHPGAAAVLATHPISSALANELAPSLAALAETEGLSPSDAGFAMQSIYVFTSGHALAEHGDPPEPPSRPAQYYDDWFRFGVNALVSGIDTGAPR